MTENDNMNCDGKEFPAQGEEVENYLFKRWSKEEDFYSSGPVDPCAELRQQIADLEAQLAEARRHNELLRAVAEAARAHIGSEWNPEKTMLPESTEATCIWWLEKAINGGALEDDTID